MSVLASAFDNTKTSEQSSGSFFRTLLSMPVLRPRYADDASAVAIELQGSGIEKRRLTHLVNTLAQSPTGKALLESAAKEGYSVCFEMLSGAFGCCTCDEKTKRIALNPLYNDGKLTATLAHETRHAWQYANGLPYEFLQYNVATELKMWRTAEADAEAAAALCALEIRAATGKSTVFEKFSDTSVRIGRAARDAADGIGSLTDLNKKQGEILKSAFKAWFGDMIAVDAYEESYLYDHLAQNNEQSKEKRMDFYKTHPMDKSLDGAEIVKMFCKTADNACYFADEPDVFDKHSRFGAISDTTRHTADRFFKIRQSDTGAAPDHSYAGLDSNGTLTGHGASPFASQPALFAVDTMNFSETPDTNARATGAKSIARPEASFLGHIFSLPVFRGFYKEEKPEVDIKLKGSKNEKKRLTALINAIAQNSPTGRKLLEDAAQNGYALGFAVQRNSFGSCCRDKKRILLNPTFDDNTLIATLTHETRHAQQHQRGVPEFYTTDFATEVRLRRATEADAQAAAAQVALEIRAATKDESVWRAFAQTAPIIAAAVMKPSIEKPLGMVADDQSSTMQDAFKGWFDQSAMMTVYESRYLRDPMRSVGFLPVWERLSVFKEMPFSKHLTSQQIVETVCATNKGECYFKHDPHILNEPQMCAVTPETKAVANHFFEMRRDITGKAKDPSVSPLPIRSATRLPAHPSRAPQTNGALQAFLHGIQR